MGPVTKVLQKEFYAIVRGEKIGPPRMADAGTGAQQAASRRIIRDVNSKQRGAVSDSRPFWLLSPEETKQRYKKRRRSMSQGITPEFILGYRAMMLDGIAREAEVTRKVIAAVPDAQVGLPAGSERPHREGAVVASGEHRYSVPGWHRGPEFQDGQSRA